MWKSRSQLYLEGFSGAMEGLIRAARGGRYGTDIFGVPHAPDESLYCPCWQCPKWDGTEWWQPKPQEPLTKREWKQYSKKYGSLGEWRYYAR